MKTAPAVISLIRRNLIFSTQCRRKHQNYAPATNFGAGYPRSDKNQSPLRLFKPEFYRKISGAHNRKPHTRYFREDSIRKAGKVKRVSRRADAGRLLVRHHSSNQWCAGFRGRVEGRTAVTGNTVCTAVSESTAHTCYTKLSKGESITASILKDVHWKETEKIITDQKTLYEELCVSRQDIPVASMCAIEYYEDSLLPLARLYNLERELDQALQEKIWLKSGGFLIIQQTEAFVAIDVNTGKHSSKKDAEENYKQINREAALEIARQLRLRNLSGMILVDFINMKNTNDQSELLQYMGSLVRSDPMQTVVVDVTALGIMEITRKKSAKTLAEQLLQLKKGE